MIRKIKRIKYFLSRVFKEAIHSFVNIFYFFECTNYYNTFLEKKSVERGKSSSLPADTEFLTS